MRILGCQMYLLYDQSISGPYLQTMKYISFQYGLGLHLMIPGNVSDLVFKSHWKSDLYELQECAYIKSIFFLFENLTFSVDRFVNSSCFAHPQST